MMGLVELHRPGGTGFVGRERELAAGLAAADVVEGGERRSLLIGGDAGVGKTRFVEELLEHVRADGWLVAAANCAGVGTLSAPLASWRELVGDVAAQLGEARCAALGGAAWESLSGLLTRGPSHWVASTSQLLDLVNEVFVGISQHTPLAVVVEDVQWADPFTIDAITSLIRSRRRARVLLVVTWRAEDVTFGQPLGVQLAEWRRSPGVAAVDLGPFGVGEVRQMLHGFTGEWVSRTAAEAVTERTGGNPLLVEELQKIDAGHPMPRELRGILENRFQGVSDKGRELLAAGALVGQMFDVELVRQVLSWTGAEMDTELRECLRQNLIVVSPGRRFGFRHALVREHALDQLMPTQRRSLHEEIAMVLTVAGAATGTESALAYHWAAAGVMDQALPWSIRAAGVASAALAHAEATALYRQSLDWWAQVEDPGQLTGFDRIDLRMLGAQSALWAGDPASLEQWCRDSLDELDPVTERARAAEWWSVFAEAARLRADDDERANRLEHAAELLSAEPASALAATVRAGLARLTTLRGDPEQGLAEAEAALGVAVALSDPAAEAACLSSVAFTQPFLDRDPVPTFWAAIMRAEQAGADLVLYQCYVNLSDSLLRVGRYEECVAAAERGIDAVTGRGMLRACGGTLWGNAAQAMIAIGKWQAAEAALNTAAELEDAAPIRWFLDELRATLLSRRGRAAEALQLLDQSADAVSRIRRPDDLLRRHITVAEALQQAGRHLDAWHAVESGLATLPAELAWGTAAQLGAIGARSLVALDQERRATGNHSGSLDPSTARRNAATDRIATFMRRVDPEPGSPADAWIRLAEAELTRMAPVSVASASGGDDRSPVTVSQPNRWAHVVELWSDLHCPYEKAYAMLRQAEAMLIARGRRHLADQLLQEAADITGHLGAEGLAGEIRGLRQMTEGSSREGHSSGLTRRELEILELLERGCSNKQIGQTLFISEKTASVHVSNILRKLGVSSRLEAAAVARIRTTGQSRSHS